MAESHITMTVDVRGMDRMRLLVWELEQLRSRMVLVGDTFASDLDRVITRFEVSEPENLKCGECETEWAGTGTLEHHEDGSHTFSPSEGWERGG